MHTIHIPCHFYIAGNQTWVSCWQGVQFIDQPSPLVPVDFIINWTVPVLIFGCDNEEKLH